MNKIYFAGSISGGREDTELYLGIIKYLKKHGKVLTEHVGDSSIISKMEDVLTDFEIHERDLNWLAEADVLVAEVTKPSLGVGYEIRNVIDQNKKVLCLYRPQNGKKLSAMIKGSPTITNREYNNLKEAKKSNR